jgi:hypothetical protein
MPADKQKAIIDQMKQDIERQLKDKVQSKLESKTA